MSRSNRNSGRNNQNGNWRQPAQFQNYQQQQQPQMGLYQQQQIPVQSMETPSPQRGSFQRPRRGGISKTKENVRNPVVAVDSLPGGQHLSKTNSELKNDPLYLEAFFPTPSEELRPIAEELNHYTGFSGFPAIVKESYENLCAHNLNFKRSINLSCYNYYLTVLAWARVLYLKKMNKYRLTTSELEFVSMVYEQGNFVLPKSIGIYFSGFGNFTIPSGPESKFNTKPYTYDNSGYFELMATRYYLTADYPNIAIAAQRIMQDLLFTANPENPEWNPNDIEAEWNNRCIGYESAQHVENMQMAVMNRAGISAQYFPSDVTQFLVNVRLMGSVQKYMLEVPSLESSPIPTNVTGSQGQFVIQNTIDSHVKLTACDDIGSVSFISESPLVCPGSLAYLGGSFLYRVKKTLPCANSVFFFPYHIADPTADQIAMLDTLNTGWSPIFHNIEHYTNVTFKPGLRLKKVCSIDVKLTSI